MQQDFLETHTKRSESLAAEWLQLIADPERTPIDATHLAVIVAHPDDETIGCGALLHRLRNATLVMLTDGAPRDLSDAHRLGFNSAQEYAAARSMELISALSLAGLTSTQVVSCNVPDQHAAFQLPDIVRQVTEVLRARKIRCVLTLAYEGGHPDHDATAFAAHVSVDLLVREGQPVGLIEMPLYHAGAETTVGQQFIEDTLSPVADLDLCEVYLDDHERQQKHSMLTAYTTQHSTLQNVMTHVERFRAAPQYDFNELPNNGRLLYEAYSWGMTGKKWQELSRRALAELGVKSSWH